MPLLRPPLDFQTKQTMSKQNVELALKLLEKAHRLLRNQPSPNIKKSRTFLRETIHSLDKQT
ncbi:MAG: hypothetical protein C0624_09675 [Desulfuromonas sp.]|nr:MAG: hypothetical protein C0624_09675 [Desulfuromonas sp.]